METITNPVRQATEKANEAIAAGKAWVEKCNLTGAADDIHFSFGFMKGTLIEAYATIALLQKELDKPRCEECGSDCTKVWSRDTYLGEATTIYCESCDHESEPF